MEISRSTKRASVKVGTPETQDETSGIVNTCEQQQNNSDPKPEAARRPPASRKWWFLQFLWLFAQEIHEPLVVYGHINVAHQYYATVRHHVMMTVWLRGKQSFKPRAHAR